MHLSPILILLLALAGPSRAAISILIEAGSPGTSIFTVTQTAPNPLLNVSGISGYARGMELPNSMFNIPGLGGGFSSDIEGDLTSSVATVTEIFTSQTYLLDRLKVSSDSTPSLLYFDTIYLVQSGATSARFEASSSGPVVTNIGFEALNPGVHTISSVLFGTVTVTIVPEPSVVLLIAAAAPVVLFARRRNERSPGKPTGRVPSLAG